MPKRRRSLLHAYLLPMAEPTRRRLRGASPTTPISPQTALKQFQTPTQTLFPQTVHQITGNDAAFDDFPSMDETWQHVSPHAAALDSHLDTETHTFYEKAEKTAIRADLEPIFAPEDYFTRLPPSCQAVCREANWLECAILRAQRSERFGCVLPDPAELTVWNGKEKSAAEEWGKRRAAVGTIAANYYAA